MNESPRRTDSDAGVQICLPELPDHLYVVFCRIPSIHGMPTDRLAASMQALRDVCEEIATDSASGVYAIHSSVYGRFLCARSPAPSLEIAKRVLSESADRGVRLAVGVAAGRLERLEDLARDNLVGHAINLAARLAAMAAAEGHVAVEEGVVKQACDAGASFALCCSFGDLQAEKIKATELSYRILTHEVPSVDALSGVSRYRAFDAHVVVCDIAGFSQKSADEQWQVVMSLRREVLQTLDPIVGNRAAAGLLWHAPAGDGYVLVFATDGSGGDLAWTFATSLAQACCTHVEIRLGIATGSVVTIGDDLPVGQGILIADHASSLPESGQLCVNTLFWDGRRDGVRGGWKAQPVAEDPTMLCLHPLSSDRSPLGGTVPGNGGVAPVAAAGGGGLTIQTFIQQGHLNTLANLFPTPIQQQLLLVSVGYPMGLAPTAAQTPQGFWTQVCTHIAAGGAAGVTLRSLLVAASRQYPGNAALAAFAN